MKSIAYQSAMILVAMTVLLVALWPESGLVYQGPLGTIGVGLIGLALIRSSVERRALRVGREPTVDS